MNAQPASGKPLARQTRNIQHPTQDSATGPCTKRRNAAAAISLPFVWLTACETKDKTLERMKDTTELDSFFEVRER
jgi:hypothetical protein